MKKKNMRLLILLVALITGNAVANAQANPEEVRSIVVRKPVAKTEEPVSHPAVESKESIRLVDGEHQKSFFNMYELPLIIEGTLFFQPYRAEPLTGSEKFVRFDFVVDELGEVSEVRILESNDQLLSKLISLSMKSTRWRPATKDGELYRYRFPDQMIILEY